MTEKFKSWIDKIIAFFKRVANPQWDENNNPAVDLSTDPVLNTIEVATAPIVTEAVGNTTEEVVTEPVTIPAPRKKKAPAKKKAEPKAAKEGEKKSETPKKPRKKKVDWEVSKD